MSRQRDPRPHPRPGTGPTTGEPAIIGVAGAWGFSLVELLFALGVFATVSAVAVPEVTRARERYQAYGAVRFLAARLHEARALAVSRGANVGMRFESTGGRVRWTTYIDGNRNGVAGEDILSGADPRVAESQGLDVFGAVEFGLWSGVPSPDDEPLADGNPIRIGRAGVLSFSPRGTATPGSLYVKGPRGLQFVVRVYGDTGKIQCLKYAAPQGVWGGL